jgi:antitoxin YobK
LGRGLRRFAYKVSPKLTVYVNESVPYSYLTHADNSHAFCFSMNDITSQAAAVQHLLATRADAVDFAEFGDGISEEWIQRAEGRLGVAFPPSYRWWLRNYGGGTIYGDEVFSVYGLDFDTISGGDVVHMNELDRMREGLPPEHLRIMNDYLGQEYFLDLSRANDASEAPVYVSFGKETQLYAASFFDFLAKQLSE